MANAAHKVWYSFRDSQGRTARMTVYVYADSATVSNPIAIADDLGPYIAACSNAAMTIISGVPAVPTYGTNATFASAQDKAVMIFFTSNGAKHVLQIPAPIAGLFFADTVTVNPAQTQAAAFISNVAAYACNANGQLLTTFVAGYRQRRKLPKRVGSLVLDPPGTGGAD